MLLPSHRTKPRVPDRRDDLLLGHPEGHSCGRHYVLLHHRAPVVVPAEEEPDLGDLRPHRHPRHLDRADVPENDPRDGQHAEVADRVAEPRYPTLPEPGVASPPTAPHDTWAGRTFGKMTLETPSTRR